MKKLKIETERHNSLSPSKNHFLSLCSSIIYQQISTKAGDSIYNRFLKLFKNRKPTPKLLLNISDLKLRSAGLSPQKLSYIRDLSNKFLDKSIEAKQFDAMNNTEIKEHLIRVKGIGSWTADMFLIFALNRQNVLPMGDLGIRNGFKKTFKLKNSPSETQMKRLSKPYEDELTKFSIFLWSNLDKN